MESAIQALTEQRRLLQIEYQSEKESFHDLVDRIGVVRLVQRGKARFPIRIGRVWYNSVNQRVIEITVDEQLDPESNHEDGFEPGRPVSFFIVADNGPQSIRRLFTGSISFVDDHRIVIAIPEDADTERLRGAETCGLLLSFDETGYRTMFEALDRTIKAKGRLGELRDLVYSTQRVGELLLPPMRFPYLNQTQEQAVNKVLRAKDVSIVHGPPGTGKTTTLVEAIYETLRRDPQVMVCAQSNMAVDWISEQLVDHGIKVVRIGNPTRVNDKMLSFTYERRFEAHPEYPTLWGIRRTIRQLYQSRGRGGDNWHQKVERLQSRAAEIEIRINRDIFADARVVASTLVGSASRLLEGMTFPTLFIDEAAQALEAAAWIAIRRAGRVIFAGDHCQLPPVVKSLEAMKGGLGRSLMERIVANHPEAVTLLSTQYRMNEDIMRFSSDWFYQGKMIAAKEVRYRGILDYDVAIDWIDTAKITETTETDKDVERDRAEEKDGDKQDSLPELPSMEQFREQVYGAGYGRINKAEAELTISEVKKYIGKIGRERIFSEKIDFGVISPYRAQVAYLRRRVWTDSFFKPYRNLISINTVDGFQGRERDVIFISLVRSNDEGQIGFLRDLRRMNVAMTRARMKLLIVGDRHTLSSNPFYRRLATYIESLHDAH